MEFPLLNDSFEDAYKNGDIQIHPFRGGKNISLENKRKN